MLGIQTTAKTMNGIISISDGTLVIENGKISNCNSLDADSISTNTLSGSSLVVPDVSCTTVEFSSTLNGLTAAQLATLAGINTGTTIQAQLDGKMSNAYSASYFGIYPTNAAATNSSLFQAALTQCATDEAGFFFDQGGTYNFLHQRHVFAPTTQFPFSLSGQRYTVLAFASSATGFGNAKYGLIEVHGLPSTFGTYYSINTLQLQLPGYNSNMLLLDGLAFSTVKDVQTLNGYNGISLYNCISCYGYRLACRFSGNCGVAMYGQDICQSVSAVCNQITLESISVTGDYAGIYLTNGGCVYLRQIDIEGAGVAGSASTYGVYAHNFSANASGLSIDGGYLEGNMGLASVCIDTGSVLNANSVSNVFFDRLGSTGWATNQIQFNSLVSSALTVSGCSFRSYNGYVPTAARPLYGSTSPSTSLWWLSGNVYQDTVEYNAWVPTNEFDQPIPADLSLNSLTVNSISSSQENGLNFFNTNGTFISTAQAGTAILCEFAPNQTNLGMLTFVQPFSYVYQGTLTAAQIATCSAAFGMCNLYDVTAAAYAASLTFTATGLTVNRRFQCSTTGAVVAEQYAGYISLEFNSSLLTANHVYQIQLAVSYSCDRPATVAGILFPTTTPTHAGTNVAFLTADYTPQVRPQFAVTELIAPANGVSAFPGFTSTCYTTTMTSFVQNVDQLTANTFECPAFTPMVLVYDGTTSLRQFLAVQCNMSNISGGNVDDVYLVPAGVKLVKYTSSGYGGTVETFDNTTGTVSAKFVTANPNSLASCQYFLYGVLSSTTL